MQNSLGHKKFSSTQEKKLHNWGIRKKQLKDPLWGNSASILSHLPRRVPVVINSGLLFLLDLGLIPQSGAHRLGASKLSGPETAATSERANYR
jgi:hypothetical protein